MAVGEGGESRRPDCTFITRYAPINYNSGN